MTTAGCAALPFGNGDDTATADGSSTDDYSVHSHNSTGKRLDLEVEVDYALGATPTDTTDPEPLLSETITLAPDEKRSWKSVVTADGDYVFTAALPGRENELFADIHQETLRIDATADEPEPGVYRVELVRAKNHPAWADDPPPADFQPGYGLIVLGPGESL